MKLLTILFIKKYLARASGIVIKEQVREEAKRVRARGQELRTEGLSDKEILKRLLGSVSGLQP